MTDTIQYYVQQLGRQARQAARLLNQARTADKNNALLAIADALTAATPDLIAANQQDLMAGEANGLAPALLDRLTLNASRIQAMREGLLQVAALPDPIGEISHLRMRPSGIQVGQMRVPLGVIGIIYESRPNVTIDAAALCLKAGNASILRGGSEAIHSNQALAKCIQAGLVSAGLPETAVQVVNTPNRAVVGELIQRPEYIDIIIPRGGKGLIERISREAKVPVIKHLDGICHIYVDEDAPLEKSLRVIINAKTQRCGTCNALETLLVAQAIAPLLLPRLGAELQARSVILRGCPQTQALLPGIEAATEDDWHTEYLAPILSIKIVAGLDEAIEHIEYYGSHHTDSILTNHWAHAQRFLREVDSSSVMVNTSTRFADGFEYGLGAEIGISTDKLHARGPVGLEGLTTQKYIVLGDGHIRQS